ncbi:MAG: electron transport complex subunit RsxC [Bacteroidales bacterium]|nr:electron transport complex subunit RsxC [Bacteroidales bacterium]
MKTFKRGGIHPEENKFAHDIKLEDFPIPKQAVLYASQHLGAPSTVVVNKGDKVKVGQLIAKGEAFISANLHASCSGEIAKIEPVADITGNKKQAIYINVEGDEWEDSIDRTPDIISDIRLDKNEIIERIKSCGIVGLGGACFPTHVKLMIPEGKKAEYCIINAAECEPYICIDNRIMLERGEELIIGATILRKALSLTDVYIGVEHNKKQAIPHLTQLAQKYAGVHIVTLRTKYPQGAEKQLIKAITGREVPAGKLPIDVGCVVDNVSTALAVYEAVQKNKPLISNYLTYSGKSVQNPKNYNVRLGTPIMEIIQANGGLKEDTGKVISGGPMMGKAITNLNAYTAKGFSSLLQMTQKEASRMEPQNCIRCGKCVSACPMGLEPYLLSVLSRKARWEECEQNQIMSCMECGCCQFTCPSFRPLLDYMRLGKNKTGAMIKARAQKK